MAQRNFCEAGRNIVVLHFTPTSDPPSFGKLWIRMVSDAHGVIEPPSRGRKNKDIAVRESITEEGVLKNPVSYPCFSLEAFHDIPVDSMDEPFVEFPASVRHVLLLFLAEIVHDRDKKPLILFFYVRRKLLSRTNSIPQQLLPHNSSR